MIPGDKCRYVCNNKTSLGYCKSTVCVYDRIWKDGKRIPAIPEPIPVKIMTTYPSVQTIPYTTHIVTNKR
jgi:hypothetical protein